MHLSNDEVLNQVIEISSAVATVKDIDILLEHILTRARQISNADAGSIYLKEGNKLKFFITQNDTLQKRLPEGKKLVYSVFTVNIDNKTISGYVANTGKILNIEDVYSIPENEPYTFGKKYDQITDYRSKSMLTIPLKTHLGKIVGVLQIINSQDKNKKVIPFNKNLLTIMDFFANNAAISIERAQITREIILRMIRMAELRDPKETGAHVNRVAAYSVEIYEVWAKRRDLPENVIERNKDVLRIAAMLHDVGKVGISDLILKKNGKLTELEYLDMKKHTVYGFGLFAEPDSEIDIAAAKIALNHHERWDGKGYPGNYKCDSEENILLGSGKKGDEIPLYARIVAIADVYDALSSKRIYKDAWNEEDTLREIKNSSGNQFDPELVDCFFECIEIIKSVAKRYK